MDNRQIFSYPVSNWVKLILSIMLKLLRTLLLPVIVTASFQAAANTCGSLQNAYGPFDYRNPQHFREKLPVVEINHFNQAYESLKKGQTSSTPGPDLDYVLRAFPNHTRALYSMARLQLKHQRNSTKPDHRVRTFECYIDRALRLKSDDGYVYLVNAYYLHQKLAFKKSLDSYLKAQPLLPEGNLDLHYNLGLLYYDM